jgi:peptidoglycan/LPS O-acetylase OafA/YrhL
MESLATQQAPAPGDAGSVRSYEEYRGRKYIPELDGLRAISILLVITWHMWDRPVFWEWLRGGEGVRIFFVLSGYLITTLLLEEESKRGKVSLPAFYVRRSCRIFPLYYVVLLAYCVLIYGFNSFAAKRAEMDYAMPYLLFYLQEIPFYLHPDGVWFPFYQSWSLGIEEKFYLVWPVMAFILLHGCRQWRLALGVCFAALFAFLPLCGLGAWTSCVSDYYTILVGCCAAIVLFEKRHYERLKGLGSALGSWCAFGFLLATHFSFERLPSVFVARLYPIAVAVFMVSLLAGRGLFGRALGCAPLVFIGKVSYGMYLVHLLCSNAANLVFRPGSGQWYIGVLAYLLTCLLCIAVAKVLSVTIEQPFIRIGHRWSARIFKKA